MVLHVSSSNDSLLYQAIYAQKIFKIYKKDPISLKC